jgi:hypothetical protein
MYSYKYYFQNWADFQQIKLIFSQFWPNIGIMDPDFQMIAGGLCLFAEKDDPVQAGIRGGQ